MRAKDILPTHTHHRFPLTIRIIAQILVVTFLAQDIVWAHPDPITKPQSTQDKLAPNTIFHQEGKKEITAGVFVEHLIEKHPAIGENISLDAIARILELDDIKAWCYDNGITHVADMDPKGCIKEIRIRAPFWGLLRYFDPDKARESIYEKASAGPAVHLNSNLWKQHIAIPEDWDRQSYVRGSEKEQKAIVNIARTLSGLKRLEKYYKYAKRTIIAAASSSLTALAITTLESKNGIWQPSVFWVFFVTGGVSLLILYGLICMGRKVIRERLHREDIARLNIQDVKDAGSLARSIDRLVQLIRLYSNDNTISLYNILLKPQNYEDTFFAPLFELLLSKTSLDFEDSEEFTEYCGKIIRREGVAELRMRIANKDEFIVKAFKSIKKGARTKYANISLYGPLLFYLTTNVESPEKNNIYLKRLLSLKFDVTDPDENICFAAKGVTDHTRGDSVVHYYKKGILFESGKEDEKIYRNSIMPQYAETQPEDRKNTPHAEKIGRALRMWQMQSSKATFGYLEKPLGNFLKGTTVVEIDKETPLIFSNPDNNVVRFIHVGRNRKVIFFSSPFIEEASEAEIAASLIYAQRFLDVGAESDEGLQSTRHSITQKFFEPRSMGGENSGLINVEDFRKRLRLFMEEDTMIRYSQTMLNAMKLEEGVAELLILGDHSGDRNYFGEAIVKCGNLLDIYEGMGIRSWAERAYQAMKIATEGVHLTDEGKLPYQCYRNLVMASLRYELWDDFMGKEIESGQREMGALEKYTTGRGSARRMKRTEIDEVRTLINNLPLKSTIDHALKAHRQAAISKREVMKIEEVEKYAERILNNYSEFENLKLGEIDYRAGMIGLEKRVLSDDGRLNRQKTNNTDKNVSILLREIKKQRLEKSKRQYLGLKGRYEFVTSVWGRIAYLTHPLLKKEMSALLEALDKFSRDEFKIKELDAIVVNDPVKIWAPKAWMIGFNTLPRSQNARPDRLSTKLQEQLVGMESGTAFLSKEVLDWIGANKPLLYEYLFLVAIAPYLRHDVSRYLRENLFPENYDMIKENSSKGFTTAGRLERIFAQIVEGKREENFIAKLKFIFSAIKFLKYPLDITAGYTLILLERLSGIHENIAGRLCKQLNNFINQLESDGGKPESYTFERGAILMKALSANASGIAQDQYRVDARGVAGGVGYRVMTDLSDIVDKFTDRADDVGPAGRFVNETAIALSDVITRSIAQNKGLEAFDFISSAVAILQDVHFGRSARDAAVHAIIEYLKFYSPFLSGSDAARRYRALSIIKYYRGRMEKSRSDLDNGPYPELIDFEPIDAVLNYINELNIDALSQLPLGSNLRPAAENRQSTIHLNSDELKPLVEVIKQSIVSGKAPTVNNFIAILPSGEHSFSMRNALMDLSKLQGEPYDEMIETIVVRNQLNEDEQKVFALVIYPGQGSGFVKPVTYKYGFHLGKWLQGEGLPTINIPALISRNDGQTDMIGDGMLTINIYDHGEGAFRVTISLAALLRQSIDFMMAEPVESFGKALRLAEDGLTAKVEEYFNTNYSDSKDREIAKKFKTILCKKIKNDVRHAKTKYEKSHIAASFGKILDPKLREEGKRYFMMQGGKPRNFDYRWMIFESLDDQIMGNIEEREWIFGALKEIAHIQKLYADVRGEKGKISEAKCMEIEEKLKEIESDIEVRLPNKQKASGHITVALGNFRAGGLENMRESYRNLNLAIRMLGDRKKDVENIYHALRRKMQRLTAWAREMNSYMASLTAARYEEPLYALANRDEIKAPYNEPEFDGIEPLVREAIRHIKYEQNSDKEKMLANLKMAREEILASSVFRKFAMNFKEAVYDARYSGIGKPVGKPEDIFEDMWLNFLKENSFTLGPPAYCYAKLYQTAFIHQTIPNPEKISERIPNPVFRAAARFIRLLDIENIDSILNARSLLLKEQFADMRAFLEGLKEKKTKFGKPKISIYDLSIQERKELVRRIAVDSSLNRSGLAILNKCAKQFFGETQKPADLSGDLTWRAPGLEKGNGNESSISFTTFFYRSGGNMRPVMPVIDERDCMEGGEFYNKALYGDKESGGTFEGIMPIFGKVIDEEGLPKDQVELMAMAFNIEPKYTANILFMEDGKKNIVINKAFVSMIAFQLKYGYQRIKLNDKNTNKTSDLVTSEVHSIALHEIRAHIMLNLPENDAQNRRGRNYGDINILAMIYYWSLTMPKYEERRMKNFFENNPHLESKFGVADCLEQINDIEKQRNSWGIQRPPKYFAVGSDEWAEWVRQCPSEKDGYLKLEEKSLGVRGNEGDVDAKNIPKAPAVPQSPAAEPTTVPEQAVSNNFNRRTLLSFIPATLVINALSKLAGAEERGLNIDVSGKIDDRTNGSYPDIVNAAVLALQNIGRRHFNRYYDINKVIFDIRGGGGLRVLIDKKPGSTPEPLFKAVIFNTDDLADSQEREAKINQVRDEIYGADHSLFEQVKVEWIAGLFKSVLVAICTVLGIAVVLTALKRRVEYWRNGRVRDSVRKDHGYQEDAARRGNRGYELWKVNQAKHRRGMLSLGEHSDEPERLTPAAKNKKYDPKLELSARDSMRYTYAAAIDQKNIGKIGDTLDMEIFPAAMNTGKDVYAALNEDGAIMCVARRSIDELTGFAILNLMGQDNEFPGRPVIKLEAYGFDRFLSTTDKAEVMKGLLTDGIKNSYTQLVERTRNEIREGSGSNPHIPRYIVAYIPDPDFDYFKALRNDSDKIQFMSSRVIPSSSKHMEGCIKLVFDSKRFFEPATLPPRNAKAADVIADSGRTEPKNWDKEKIEVRPLQDGDIPEILKIENDSFKYPLSEELLRYCLRHSWCLDVAVWEGQIIGFMAWEMLQKNGNAYHIVDFAAANGFRRMGVASALMKNMFKKMRRNPPRSLLLEVPENNLQAQLFLRSNKIPAYLSKPANIKTENIEAITVESVERKAYWFDDPSLYYDDYPEIMERVYHFGRRSAPKTGLILPKTFANALGYFGIDPKLSWNELSYFQKFQVGWYAAFVERHDIANVFGVVQFLKQHKNTRWYHWVSRSIGIGAVWIAMTYSLIITMHLIASNLGMPPELGLLLAYFLRIHQIANIITHGFYNIAILWAPLTSDQESKALPAAELKVPAAGTKYNIGLVDQLDIERLSKQFPRRERLTDELKKLRSKVLKIGYDLNVLAHGVTDLSLNGRSSVPGFNRLKILNIILERTIRPATADIERGVCKGVLADWEQLDDDVYSFEKAAGVYGDYFIILTPDTPVSGKVPDMGPSIPDNYHAYYLVPDESDRMFLKAGLEQAIEKKILDSGIRDALFSKILTYEQFLQEIERIKEKISRQGVELTPALSMTSSPAPAAARNGPTPPDWIEKNASGPSGKFASGWVDRNKEGRGKDDFDNELAKIKDTVRKFDRQTAVQLSMAESEYDGFMATLEVIKTAFDNYENRDEKELFRNRVYLVTEVKRAYELLVALNTYPPSIGENQHFPLLSLPTAIDIVGDVLAEFIKKFGNAVTGGAAASQQSGKASPDRMMPEAIREEYKKLLVTPLGKSKKLQGPHVFTPDWIDIEVGVFERYGINLEEFTRAGEVVLLGFTAEEFKMIYKLCPHASVYHLINDVPEIVTEETKIIWGKFPEEVKKRIKIYNIDAEDVDKYIPAGSARFVRASGMFYGIPGNEAKNKNILRAIREITAPQGLVAIRYSMSSTHGEINHSLLLKELEKTTPSILYKHFPYIIFKKHRDSTFGAAPVAAESQNAERTTLNEKTALSIPTIGTEPAMPPNVAVHTSAPLVGEPFTVTPSAIPVPAIDYVKELRNTLTTGIENLTPVAEIQQDLKGKGLILFADDMLERGAVIDLQQTLTTTSRLNGTTMIIYEREKGSGRLLKQIIDEANKDVNTIVVDEATLKNDYDGKEDIYFNEASTLECLINFASANQKINKNDLVGIIKDRRQPDDGATQEDVDRILGEHKIPVVYFGGIGVCSFNEAVNILLSVKKSFEDGEKNIKWYRELPPIIRTDIQEIYRKYKALLAPALSA